MSAPTRERYVATRTIAASPSEVFAVLADPTRHRATEPGDWVRDAIDTEPITRVGQIFAVNMFLEAAGGHYVMHNLVTEFEPDRTIAWSPGQLDDAGKHGPGGWWWRYDLRPNGSGTDVTITYDWSGTEQGFRDAVGVRSSAPSSSRSHSPRWSKPSSGELAVQQLFDALGPGMPRRDAVDQCGDRRRIVYS